jgi:hypothetical protein
MKPDTAKETTTDLRAKVAALPAQVPALPSARTLSVRALQIAQGYADAEIREAGNNRGDQVEFFQRLIGGVPGDSWCAFFVCTCLVKAYAQLTAQKEGRDDLPHYVSFVGSHYLRLSGSCREIVAAAQSHGLWKPKGFLPVAGDLVLYDYGNLGHAHHIGIVKSATRDGRGSISIVTVEGNTSSGTSGSQDNGDGVFVKHRDTAGVIGYVHWA